MRSKKLVLASAALAVALPALAQDRVEPVAPATAAAPQPEPATSAVAAAPSRPRSTASGSAEGETGVVSLEDLNLPPPPPPVEYPAHARRDPAIVGTLDPLALGVGANPWGSASGAFLSSLMRRMDTPIASRWAHMALRNVLLARAGTPRGVHPVDWTAERAWLLLRMGEADASRLLISGIDTDRFTPKMYQVAVQSALANADAAGLCPLEDGIRKVERRVLAAVEAMCSALAGEPESAAAQIDSVRRRGGLEGIDLVLAQKVVGAGSDTGRAVTVEWEPVKRLNSWRFGLATATGMTLPDRLIDRAPVQLRAWQARAPLLSPDDRLKSALIATGLGVFSSQAITDLQSLIYDSTGPDELPETDAYRVRQAYIAADETKRLDAMRRLWKVAKGPLEREAARALLARPAAHITPNKDLQADAPDLIASMLAAGFDREAAKWADAVRGMDGDDADKAWAMLALAAPENSRVDVSIGRVSAFISRDKSPNKKRSALLVAGLTGLGRIDADTADRLNRRNGLRLERRSRWTQMIDGTAVRGQAGSTLVLAGSGLQTASFADVPSSHLLHIVAALRRTGLEYTARMVAAEALART